MDATLREPSYLYEWPESDRLKKVLYVESPKLEHCYTMPGLKSVLLNFDHTSCSLFNMLHKFDLMTESVTM